MKKTYLIGSLAFVAMLTATNAASLFGVTTDNQLVTFNTANPSVFQTSVAITGLFEADGVTPNPNGLILNLATRPGATPKSLGLWGIDNNANIYTINRNGAATLVSSGFSPAGFSAGFAYDPFNDNFVYAGDNAENFSISLAGAATANSDFTYAGGGTPSIFGLGIDPFLGTAFAVDAVNDSLSTSSDPLFPGNSELGIVGGLGVDVTSFGGLAVDFDGNLFASLSTDGLTSSLYSIDTTTGAATEVGSFGSGVGMTAIAANVPDGGTTFVLLGGALTGLGLLRRKLRHA